eukprot:TRINITY_DN8065_c0_g1_i1.p1 TRINITY_DN8065_c0_g1~~TRINITY_DN8065_c0_g1_i1.p1  ORF type:complete len:603 (+),score=125.55 TRINITY_DN8065_c0_g1_i1:134-1942(+)
MKRFRQERAVHEEEDDDEYAADYGGDTATAEEIEAFAASTEGIDSTQDPSDDALTTQPSRSSGESQRFNHRQDPAKDQPLSDPSQDSRDAQRPSRENGDGDGDGDGDAAPSAKRSRTRTLFASAFRSVHDISPDELRKRIEARRESARPLKRDTSKDESLISSAPNARTINSSHQAETQRFHQQQHARPLPVRSFRASASQPHAKVDNRTYVYEIEASTQASLDFDFEHEDVQLHSCLDKSIIADSEWVPEGIVLKLWAQKSRLDDIFDSGLSRLYYEERDSLFPLDKRGSNVYWNRAGDKLREVAEAAPFLQREQGSTEFYFADVCGGPGAWSQYIMIEEPFAIGFGMTLRTSQSPKTDDWYPSLTKNDNFRAFYGSDGSGNVYLPDNVNGLEELIRKETEDGLHTVVADGGFEILKSETGEHLENVQELFAGRIILSELLCATQMLRTGGSFVCKLYDCFSPFTVSILYLCKSIFQKVHIVKPAHSRLVNSERYLVARDIIAADHPSRVRVMGILRHFHTTATDGKIVKTCIPLETMRADPKFKTSIRLMLTDIAERQTNGLQQVMDRVETRSKENEQPTRSIHQSQPSGRFGRDSFNRR